MGSSNSKANSAKDDHIKPIRRQIGKRSSVNFLQRLDSRPAPAPRAASLPPSAAGHHRHTLPAVPMPLSSHPTMNPALSPSSTATVVKRSDIAPLILPGRDSSEKNDVVAPAKSGRSVDSSHTPPSSQTASSCTTPTNSSDSSGRSNNSKSSDDGCDRHDSEDDSPLLTPQLTEESQSSRAHTSTPEGDDKNSEAITPLAKPLLQPPAPMLRAHTPLARESPTHYGFEEVMETVRINVDREMKKKRAPTAPELFHQAVDLQVVSGFTNILLQPKDTTERRHTVGEVPCRVYKPARSKNSPAELFCRAQMKHHIHLPPRQKDSSPRTLRLQRRPWPANLIRDELSPPHSTRYAIALPLTQFQLFCCGHHRQWQESSNYLYPVECAICLCASDCPTDSIITWTCVYCALRVCTECKAVFDDTGVKALMSRFRDGSRTAEGRKMKANRKSTV